MRGVLIPGYKDLYGESVLGYDELLKNTSSDTVIMLLISLNAELNTEEVYSENQARLFEAVTLRFSAEQLLLLKGNIASYMKVFAEYDGTLFSRRYLLSMILKELKRNNKTSVDTDAAIHEYNFLLGYLLMVDEVNENDHKLLDIAKKYDLHIMPTMPLIWAMCINQYEFNDMVNPAFEIFKLLSFCKYSYDNHKKYLKEYINKYGFKSISNFLASSHQVVKSTMVYQESEFLRKLYFIVPKEGVEHTHLTSQSINTIRDNHQFTIDDLRRLPLYETQKRGFMVVDEDMYKKKIYRGPLFGLNKETSMCEEIIFDNYKNEISKKCFEEILFRGIVRQLGNKENSIFHIDCNSDKGEPDLYYRNGNDIFLIEFKDYLFPDAIIKGTSFGAYKNYIHERFLTSDKGKRKGVSQLANCISNILNKKYDFDDVLNEKINRGERMEIHSIICHTDFMFSMPGLNEYLNCLFLKQIKEQSCTYAGINSITIVNLETLFDLALRGGDFKKLLTFIKAYFQKIENLRKVASFSLSTDDYVPSTTSFDEMYNIYFRNEMIDKGELTDKVRVKKMTDIIGIKQEQIDEIL